MILVDTTELMRPTQLKLHAAWQELQGRQVLATPSVARELAPLAVDVPWMGRPSDAENRLKAGESRLPKRRQNELRQQAWWGEMWADGNSPYRIIALTREQEELAERIRTVIDPACFPNTDPEDIPDLGDAAVVSESMAVGAKLLLTSDLRSIDHILCAETPPPRRAQPKDSDRYKVAKCIQAEPVFCGFGRSAHSKVISVSVLTLGISWRAPTLEGYLTPLHSP